MPIMVPPVAAVTGELEYYWVDSNEVVHSLSRNSSVNLFVSHGSAGLGTPRFDITEDKLPLSPGSLVSHINTSTRRMEVPILIKQDTLGDLVNQLEEVHSWFDTGDETARRPGYFRVVRPDGTVRQILSYYTGGLDGDLKEGGPQWVRYVVSLYCPDPYPTEEEDTVVTKTVAQAASFAVINQGKLDAFPIWKLTGPFVNATLYNSSTDKTLELTITLTGGQYVIIDTRPSQIRSGFTVYDQTGVSRLSTVSATSDYWPLISNQNNMEVTFDSGTSGATSVELTYLARYRSLLR